VEDTIAVLLRLNVAERSRDAGEGLDVEVFTTGTTVETESSLRSGCALACNRRDVVESGLSLGRPALVAMMQAADLGEGDNLVPKTPLASAPFH